MKNLILLASLVFTLTSCTVDETELLTVNNNTTVVITPTTPTDTTTTPVVTPEEPVTPEQPTVPQDLNPDWLLGNWISEEINPATGYGTLAFGQGYGNMELNFTNPQGEYVLAYPHIQYIINSPIDTGELSNFEVHQENNLNWIEFDFLMYSHPDNPMHIEIHKMLTNDGSDKITITLTNNQGNYMFRPFIRA